jgi:uncharacterized protein (DUF488 family)
MDLFTIGSGKKNAEQFFETLKKAGVKKVLDIRLNNTSQLAGFSKKPDLAYFLKVIGGIEYAHLPSFAPTAELLDAYKAKTCTWDDYEKKFQLILDSRANLNKYSSEFFDNACLLCSEPTASKCHRRLVAEYVTKHYPDVRVVHL